MYKHIYLILLIIFFSFQLLKHVTIASGGVLPKIHPELLTRKKGNKIVSLAPTPRVLPAPPKPQIKNSPKKQTAPPKKVASQPPASPVARKSKVSSPKGNKVSGLIVMEMSFAYK